MVAHMALLGSPLLATGAPNLQHVQLCSESQGADSSRCSCRSGGGGTVASGPPAWRPALAHPPNSTPKTWTTRWCVL